MSQENISDTPQVQTAISLRDWFAGMALQGLEIHSKDYESAAVRRSLAKSAYNIADAMLEQRNARS